jgi:hypothetical protein
MQQDWFFPHFGTPHFVQLGQISLQEAKMQFKLLISAKKTILSEKDS